jgi:hypothetical protein
LHIINTARRARVTLAAATADAAVRYPGESAMALDSAQIRHKNFQKLFNDFVAQHSHLPQRGMLKLFAERLDLSDRYLSHIKCNRKNIGNNVARAIEDRLKLPHGWMDREHDSLHLPVDEKERLFVETALTLFRAQPNEARELMLEQLRQRLQSASPAHEPKRRQASAR